MTTNMESEIVDTSHICGNLRRESKDPAGLGAAATQLEEAWSAAVKNCADRPGA
jgi:hypothetical protein